MVISANETTTFYHIFSDIVNRAHSPLRSLRPLRLPIYTFYMFYTAKGASGARLGARPNRRLQHPASRNAPGCFAKVSQTVGSWRRFGFRTSNNKLRLACHASASITGCVQYASYACEPRPLLSYGNNCQGPIACDFAHPLSALPCIFSSLTPFRR